MIWTVHRQVRDGRTVRARVVPDTTAKWALVFGSLWLLRHKLWWEALVFFLLTVLANRVAALAFEGEANPAVLLTFGLVLLPRLWLFLEGNEMRRAKLAREGYVETGVVRGGDEEEAQAAVLRTLPQAPPPHADPALARSA